MFSQQQSACTQRLQSTPSFSTIRMGYAKKVLALQRSYMQSPARKFPASERFPQVSCKRGGTRIPLSMCHLTTQGGSPRTKRFEAKWGDHHCAFWMDHPPDWPPTPLFRTRCLNKPRLQTPTAWRVGRLPTSTLTCSESELTRLPHYRSTRSHGGS